MKKNVGFTYGQLEQLKELEQMSIVTTSSQTIAKPLVVRRIYMEMIHERDHVENNPKYTVSYREGYSEAVRCLGLIIKQLTSEDVR